jgi:hypothetical protein
VHAVVRDDSVTDLCLMDAATAQQFRDQGFVEMLWPGATLVDVTDVDPQPQIGWTYDGEHFAPPSGADYEGVES